MKKTKQPPSSTERVGDYRARLAAEGGRQIAVHLNAAADAKLTLWQAKGQSITECINGLLIRSRP